MAIYAIAYGQGSLPDIDSLIKLNAFLIYYDRCDGSWIFLLKVPVIKPIANLYIAYLCFFYIAFW